MDIPRIGTDTKIRIELVPFGLWPEGSGWTCFAYQEQEPFAMLSGIQRIVREMENDLTISHLLDGNFEAISEQDEKLISVYIGTDFSRFKSLGEIQQHLIRLKKIHEVYHRLDTHELLLGWNRETSRFYIKEKGKPVERVSFLDFLKEQRYWGFLC